MFLLIIFTLELAAGIAGYVRHNDVKNLIASGLNKTMEEYPKNQGYQKTWNMIQNDVSY